MHCYPRDGYCTPCMDDLIDEVRQRYGLPKPPPCPAEIEIDYSDYKETGIKFQERRVFYDKSNPLRTIIEKPTRSEYMRRVVNRGEIGECWFRGLYGK